MQKSIGNSVSSKMVHAHATLAISHIECKSQTSRNTRYISHAQQQSTSIKHTMLIRIHTDLQTAWCPRKEGGNTPRTVTNASSHAQADITHTTDTQLGKN